MLKYLSQLFRYDLSINQSLLHIIKTCKEPDKSKQLMAHMLAAQQVWFSRALEIPAGNIVLWPEIGTVDVDLVAEFENSTEKWLKFLSGLKDEDLEKAVHYKNTIGESFNNKLIDIIIQVLNHGTHHRAQIGQLLKAQGVEKLPITDYIFYVRNLK